MTMRIGYIGLGSLAAPGRQPVAGGLSVTVSTSTQTRRASRRGRRLGRSAAETARASTRNHLSALPEAVAATVTGEHGVLEGLASADLDRHEHNTCTSAAPGGDRRGKGVATLESPVTAACTARPPA